jgi:hypothetical protein
VASVGWNASPAAAHNSEVSAVNVCLDGAPNIKVSATAWQTELPPDHRINNDVRIDVTGSGTSRTMHGLFVAPDFEAQVVFDVPEAVGTVLTVRATAVAPWGATGEYGYAGTWRETRVAVTGGCTPTAAPTTTVPVKIDLGTEASSPAAPSPEEVQVLGASLTRAPAAATPEVAVAPKLAFSGTDARPLVLVGLASTIAGALALIATRRRRTAQ